MAEKKANGVAGATGQGGGATAAQAGAKVSKMDAVARAMGELGRDATRPQIQAFVKDRFGYVMTPDHISNCKSDLARRAKKASAKKAAPNAPHDTKPATSPTRQKPVASPRVVAVASNSRAKGSVPLDDILAVKSLVERLGADHLRTLIAAFER